jgi:hypothetical protein
MKFSRIRWYSGALVIVALVGLGYYFRADVNRLLAGLLNRVQPCQRPITYSITAIDSRFGLSKAAALGDLRRAEAIWESPIGKQLFQYSPTGDLHIDFIYDYRQAATDSLKKIGVVIGTDRASYDALKTKYDALVASYRQQKANIDALVAAYTAAKTAYEQEVAYWNGRGGAPPVDYAALQQKKADLNAQGTAINQAEDSLNALVDTINAAESVLNSLVTTLNLQVDSYNAVGSSVGKTFNEGEYVSGAGGAEIHIYEFSDTNQLTRVLAHEFGHALGIGHLPNPKAIMYYLNEGINQKLTADDLAALKQVCGIK